MGLCSLFLLNIKELQEFILSKNAIGFTRSALFMLADVNKIQYDQLLLKLASRAVETEKAAMPAADFESKTHAPDPENTLLSLPLSQNLASLFHKQDTQTCKPQKARMHEQNNAHGREDGYIP